eukprot:NODE_265_length_12372_cov_0.450012.p5 type:complete len:406 gc:universal NODE_265_length_12372_cov_0.450012:3371-2154(-)
MFLNSFVLAHFSAAWVTSQPPRQHGIFYAPQSINPGHKLKRCGGVMPKMPSNTISQLRDRKLYANPDGEVTCDGEMQSAFERLVKLARLRDSIESNPHFSYKSLSEIVTTMGYPLIQQFLQIYGKSQNAVEFLLSDINLYGVSYLNVVWPFFFNSFRSASQYFEEFLSVKKEEILMDLSHDMLSYDSVSSNIDTPNFIAFVVYKYALKSDIKINTKSATIDLCSDINEFGLPLDNNDVYIKKYLTILNLLYILTVDSVESSKRVQEMRSLLRLKDVISNRESIKRSSIFNLNMNAMFNGHVKWYDEFLVQLNAGNEKDLEWFAYLFDNYRDEIIRDWEGVNVLMINEAIRLNSTIKIALVYKFKDYSYAQTLEILDKRIEKSLHPHTWLSFRKFYTENARLYGSK